MASTRSSVLLVLGGAGCIASSAVLVRLSGASPAATAVGRLALSLPVLALLTRYDARRHARTPMPRRAVWLARIGGAFLAGDLVAWAHTINAVGSGLATVLGNLQVLFVGLIAWWLLREKPSVFFLGGMPLLLGGVAMIGGVGGSGAYGAHPGLGVVFGLITSISYAGYILLLRQSVAGAPGAGPVRALTEAMVGGSVAAALLALGLRDFRIGPLWPDLAWLAVMALTSQVLGWLLITVALPRLPAATTSLLLLVQPAGAIGLGALIFREDPSVEQLLGVAVLLAGVVIATGGSARKGRGRDVPPPDGPQAAGAAGAAGTAGATGAAGAAGTAGATGAAAGATASTAPVPPAAPAPAACAPTAEPPA